MRLPRWMWIGKIICFFRGHPNVLFEAWYDHNHELYCGRCGTTIWREKI